MTAITYPSRYRQISYVAGAFVLVVVALGTVKFFQIRRAMMMAPTMGPKAVTTTVVTQRDWRKVFNTVGSFVAVQGTTLSAEEAGTVTRIVFESGSAVQTGQVLLELDRSVEEANLAGALSRAELARQNLERARNLRSQSALSIANLEDAQSSSARPSKRPLPAGQAFEWSISVSTSLQEHRLYLFMLLTPYFSISQSRNRYFQT
jgi:multidrug efflux pump subunit AcrA (membrane-fusion protein)